MIARAIIPILSCRAALWLTAALACLSLLPVMAEDKLAPNPRVDEVSRGFSLSLSPQLIELTGRPGSRKTFTLKVRNHDAYRPLQVYLWPADVIQQENGAVTFRELGSYEHSCAGWTEIENAKPIIPPGQEVEVRVTLRVPGGGLTGSYHGIIAVSGHPPTSVEIAPSAENESFSYLRIAFGVIIHFSVPGTLRPGALVEPMFLSNTPCPGSGLTEQTAGVKHWLVVPIRNTGNSMLYGYGWAMLRNKSAGGLVQRWRIGQREYGSRVVVYPGKRIDLYLPIDRPLPAGEYIAQARLEYAERRAVKGESAFRVTPQQAQQGFARLEGPFQSVTVGLSLTLDKELNEVTASPGGFRTGWVTVANNEDAHVQVTAQAQDVVIDSDGVLSPNVLADDQQLTVARWLKLEPAEFALPPGGRRRVQYTIAPPRDLNSYRDLVGFLQFRGRLRNALARTVTNEMIGETGQVLVVTLAGASKRTVDIGTLQVDTRPELPGIVRFGVPLRNSGDIHYFPVVTLRLQGQTDPSFRLEAQQGLGDGRVLLLPGMQRMMWIQVRQDALKPGRFQAEVLVDYGGQQMGQKRFIVDLANFGAEPTGPVKPG